MSSLSPIDLLSLAGDEQLVLRSLTKHGALTLADLSRYCQLTPAELDPLLEKLLHSGQLVEQLQQGKRLFSIRFQFRRRVVRNMPAAITNLLSQHNGRLAENIPLLASLPPHSRDQLFAFGQKRTLLIDEVLAWQGQNMAWVGVILEGLLNRTRLKGQPAGPKKIEYLRPGEWVGVAELFNQAGLADTYTAVTEATVYVWPSADFTHFVQNSPELSLALNRYLGEQLQECEQARLHNRGKLWVVEGLHPQAGVTTLAANLAVLAHQGSQQPAGQLLFWDVCGTTPTHLFGETYPTNNSKTLLGLAPIFTLPSGLDVLQGWQPSDYPVQVQLDIILNQLLPRYEYVICDTGHEENRPVLNLLRGRAQTLITLTTERELTRPLAAAPEQNPHQKRILALNQADQSLADIPAKFQVAIPAEPGLHDQPAGVWIYERPESHLTKAYQEIYRRLSLNHSLAIFVPSTMDVSQEVDNRSQVRHTLSFLGDIFGGATSSHADGVWRSEESGLVTEQVTIVSTFVSKKALDKHLNDVLEYASDLKKTMKQEAVAISVDNQLILV